MEQIGNIKLRSSALSQLSPSGLLYLVVERDQYLPGELSCYGWGGKKHNH